MNLNFTMVRNGLIPKKQSKIILTICLIATVLHDCFYIGKFTYNGVIYDGKHEPIVDIELFNRVQKMFNQSKARTHDVKFPYTGLIRCGHTLYDSVAIT